MAKTKVENKEGESKEGEDKKKKELTPIEKLELKYGKGVVLQMDDTTSVEEYEVISTGSIGLDDATGIGGVPLKRMVEIYGPESSGKSTIATHIIANAQKDGGRALYEDVEHTFDLRYAVNLGVQKKLLTLGQPGTGEECFDVLKDLIKTGDYRVAVLDSVAAAIPKEQHAGETGHSRMSRLAALMSLEIPKLVPVIADNNCVLIFINQLRSNISGYGNPEQPAGGNALKFYASMRMDVRKIVEKEDGRNKTTVKLIKNKCAPPFGDATFYVDWGIGINRTGEILEYAVENKFIEKGGSWYTLRNLETQEEIIKLQGEDKVMQFLNDNPELRNLYEQKVKEVLREQD